MTQCAPSLRGITGLETLQSWGTSMHLLNSSASTYGPIQATFLFIFPSSDSNINFHFNNTSWKKRWWNVWDLNPGLHDGRRRRNHRAMAVRYNILFFISEGPVDFKCSCCDKTFAGTVKHKKCKECIDYFICFKCDGKLFQHEHEFFNLGEEEAIGIEIIFPTP